MDHLKFTQGFNLKSLEFLIIDEADRVLETIQNDWLYHLEKHMHIAGKSLQLLVLGYGLYRSDLIFIMYILMK